MHLNFQGYSLDCERTSRRMMCFHMSFVTLHFTIVQLSWTLVVHSKAKCIHQIMLLQYYVFVKRDAACVIATKSYINMPQFLLVFL